MLNFTKIDWFEDPSQKFDGFGQTHQTHANATTWITPQGQFFCLSDTNTATFYPIYFQFSDVPIYYLAESFLIDEEFDILAHLDAY